mmetsp:Transcript_18933/g.72246  ORF Transcript_18933/g.72246 Transcript_18933/m.72246 type:complete len:352 (+) Transcript_18933:1100-2155(+)
MGGDSARVARNRRVRVRQRHGRAGSRRARWRQAQKGPYGRARRRRSAGNQTSHRWRRRCGRRRCGKRFCCCLCCRRREQQHGRERWPLPGERGRWRSRDAHRHRRAHGAGQRHSSHAHAGGIPPHRPPPPAQARSRRQVRRAAGGGSGGRRASRHHQQRFARRLAGPAGGRHGLRARLSGHPPLALLARHARHGGGRVRGGRRRGRRGKGRARHGRARCGRARRCAGRHPRRWRRHREGNAAFQRGGRGRRSCRLVRAAAPPGAGRRGCWRCRGRSRSRGIRRDRCPPRPGIAIALGGGYLRARGLHPLRPLRARPQVLHPLHQPDPPLRRRDGPPAAACRGGRPCAGRIS